MRRSNVCDVEGCDREAVAGQPGFRAPLEVVIHVGGNAYRADLCGPHLLEVAGAVDAESMVEAAKQLSSMTERDRPIQ